MRLQLQFHQALFGYEAGHHMLASSVPLPSEVRHMLAVATDLSGSAPPVGFDGAYTGFPLPGTKFYAFFCTWFAPEVLRPGCVWGHVLLIQLDDLADLPDLGVLRSACKRPALKNFSEYSLPRKFDVEVSSPSALLPEGMNLAERLLKALYTAAETPVVLIAPEATSAEEIVFALWSQQWPRLRQTFRFSTGSFADRGKGSAAFDLQVSPETNRRAWQRENDYLILDSSKRTEQLSLGDTQLWITRAVSDLLEPGPEGFRSFLRRYGTDVSKPRNAFAPLASVCDTFLSRVDWIWTLNRIGEAFPDESDALVLKRQMIKQDEVLFGARDPERSLLTASFLLTSGHSKPYQKVSLEIANLAHELWSLKQKDVLTLLAQVVREQEQSSALAFVKAFVDAIQPEELKLISQERPELIPVIVSRRPELAYHKEIWELPTNLQWRVCEVLEDLVLDPKDWGDILFGMLRARSSVDVRRTVKNAGPFAIDAAFRWLDSAGDQDYLPEQVWREALSDAAADRLGDPASLSRSALVFCCWLTPPQIVRRLLDSPRQDVWELASHPLQSLPRSLRLYAAFLLVTLGLRSGNDRGAELLTRGFFAVYDALATSDYPSEAWSLLAPELPQLGIWSEWDRCKKLRKAVSQRFSSYSKTLSKLLMEAARDSEHRALVSRLW